MKSIPDFCLYDQNGVEHCTKDYLGQWVLLYVYPKDDTPGCTKEACSIRDVWSEFAKHNAVVLGISGDSVSSHKKFETKYNLPFPLLADEDKRVLESLGVMGNKSMFGKSFLGIKRESFLIDPKGHVAKHYKNVKPEIHAQEVLADLQNLTQ